MNLVQTELGLQVRAGGQPADRELDQGERDYYFSRIADGLTPSGNEYFDDVRRLRLRKLFGGDQD